VGSLSQLQHEILIGSLLGDGTLRKQGTRINALFEVNHSVSYKEYVDWKYHIFQEHVLTPPKSRLGKGVRVAYRFTTQSLPVFTGYYHQFYVNGKKILPSSLDITPLALAVWFMDDGSRCGTSYYLNTQQFSKQEQEMLCRKFKVLGMRCNLNKDKNYWRIRFLKESSVKLIMMIEPYIHPCFYYKLRNDPVTTDSKDENPAKRG